MEIPDPNPQACLWIVLRGAVGGLHSEREVSLGHTLEIRGLCAHCDVQGQPACVNARALEIFQRGKLAKLALSFH